MQAAIEKLGLFFTTHHTAQISDFHLFGAPKRAVCPKRFGGEDEVIE